MKKIAKTPSSCPQQKGGGKINALTNKMFEAPWDMTEQELKTFMGFSAKEISENADSVGLTAAKNLLIRAENQLAHNSSK